MLLILYYFYVLHLFSSLAYIHLHGHGHGVCHKHNKARVLYLIVQLELEPEVTTLGAIGYHGALLTKLVLAGTRQNDCRSGIEIPRESSLCDIWYLHSLTWFS